MRLRFIFMCLCLSVPLVTWAEETARGASPPAESRSTPSRPESGGEIIESVLNPVEEDGWGIRLAVTPIKLGFRQPDYSGINRFNAALGIAPFTTQTFLTYGSEVGVHWGPSLRLSLGIERGTLAKSSLRNGVFREISLETERSELRMEYLGHLNSFEWSLGAFTGLGTMTLRSKTQTTDGGPVTRPTGTLDANFLLYGPRLSGAWWINPHLNIMLFLAYTAAEQYNRPAPAPSDTAYENDIRSLDYADVNLGFATLVKF